jgi:hypothetical protein
MKSLIIFITAILTSQMAYGQSAIIYDFKTKEPPKVLNATLGQNTIFKVDNINRFLYEIKIEAKQTEFYSEPPAIFNQVFNIEKKETSSVNKEAENVLSNQTDKDKATTIRTKSDEESSLILKEMQLDDYNLKFEAFKNELTRLQAGLVLPSDSIQRSQQIEILEYERTITKLTKDIEKQNNTIDSLKKTIKDEYIRVIQELYSKALNVHNSFELLEESKVLKNRLVSISLTDGLSYEESLNKTKELFTTFTFSSYPEKLISSFDMNYKQFKTSYELYLANDKVKEKYNNDESKTKASVASLYNEVESLRTAVENSKYSEIFQNINSLYTELRNKNNFCVVSDPVQAEKDIIVFNIKITPRKDINSPNALESRNFMTTVPVKGGMKIDFSTGLFITTNLYNRRYSVSLSSTDTLSSIINEDNNNSQAQISLGALMHISPRFTNNIKPAVTLGFGLNSTDISNANVFIGASAILGSQEKFIVSTGLSLSNIDYLKGKYNLNTEYATKKIESDLTEKTIRGGWFISFTYNLTNKKKE